MSEPREIIPLTGLRGVAALWVLCFHVLVLFRAFPGGAPDWLRWLGTAGYLGVDVFFVLSGFVLAYNYASAGLHASLRDYAGFLWKRLARIYPVHLAALVLFCIAVMSLVAADVPSRLPAGATLPRLLQSLTLTQAWQLPMPRAWNLVSWSISAEWAAYLAFPAVALAAGACRREAQVLAAMGILFAVLYLAIVTGPYHRTMDYGLHRLAAEFTAGVLAHRLWALRGFAGWSAGGPAALAALVVLVLGGAWVETGWGRMAVLACLPALSVVLVYGLASARGAGIGLWLSSRPAVFLGHVSYSLYMVHYILIVVVRGFLADGYFGAGAAATWLAMGLGFAGPLLLATGFYYRIEVPARHWLVKRRWLSVRNRR